MSPAQAGQEVIKRAEGRYDSLIVDAFAKFFGGQAPALAREPCGSYVLAETFPHLDDASLQFRGEFLVGFF